MALPAELAGRAIFTSTKRRRETLMEGLQEVIGDALSLDEERQQAVFENFSRLFISYQSAPDADDDDGLLAALYLR